MSARAVPRPTCQPPTAGSTSLTNPVPHAASWPDGFPLPLSPGSPTAPGLCPESHSTGAPGPPGHVPHLEGQLQSVPLEGEDREGGGQGGRRTEPREPAGHLVRSWHFPHLSVNLPRAECPLTFQGLKKKKQKITLQNSGNCQNSATTLSIPELKQNVGFREPKS